MVRTKNLPLKGGEMVVEIVRPTQVHGSVRVGLGFIILFLNAFFTFWLIQKGVEGQVFYLLVFALGLYLVLYGTFFSRSNYLVITNERIFDVQRERIFSETLSTLNLADLADVVVEKKGFFSSVLNYGLLTLHPRDGKFKFEIERVPRPAYVQNLLFEHRDRYSRQSQYLNNTELLKKTIKAIPDFSEAELTLLYEKVHKQLLKKADEIETGEERMV